MTNTHHSAIGNIQTNLILLLLFSTARFSVATVAYGISFNISSFGLNMYLTQFVYGAIEIPAKSSIYYLLDKFGRRITQAGSLLLVGISLVINIFIPKGETFWRKEWNDSIGWWKRSSATMISLAIQISQWFVRWLPCWEKAAPPHLLVQLFCTALSFTPLF